MRSPSATDVSAFVVVAALAAGAANARVVEEELDLPVRVSDAYGKAIAQTIKVTLFRDDAAAGPRPAIVINHGRAPDPAARAALGRSRYAEISRWFVGLGFIVALPTRIGYGLTGGDDVEGPVGACTSRRFGPGFTAAADETIAVIDHLRARPDVASERIVTLGQSYGGATTVAVAARNPAGVVAAINFAGGSGGDPANRAGNPCSPHEMERIYVEYGGRAKVPMLWVYTENDRYWGASYPKAWSQAYQRSGGNVRFVVMPPAGDDGHALFSRFPGLWQPVVAEFLRAQGFAMAEGDAGK